MTGVGLMHISRVWKNAGLKTGGPEWWIKTPVFISFAGAVLVSVLMLKSPWINMRVSVYPSLPLFVFNACAFSLILLRISGWIAELPAKELQGFLSGIGRDSVSYVCLNQYLIHVISRMGFTLPYLAGQTANLLLTTLILYLVNYGLISTRLRVLLGKKA